METRAPYVVVGAFVLAAIASVFGLVYWLNNAGGIGKRDMKWNDALPVITVDPERYQVRADGELLVSPPARTVPLARRYSLF